MLIVASTVYRMPVQTCVVVIVHVSVLTPPSWSQLPARATGTSATTVAKTPPSARVKTIKNVRAFPFRSARLDKHIPPRVVASERDRKTTTGGHARAILDRFINRLPRDYLSRYANFLTWENKSRNMEGIILSIRNDESERKQIGRASC